MSRHYELVGGPLDGRIASMCEEVYRIGIPTACENGCCVGYELYDWSVESDAKGQLFYAGIQSVDDTVYIEEEEDRFEESLEWLEAIRNSQQSSWWTDPDFSVTNTMPFGDSGGVDDLWDMWDASDGKEEE